MLETHFLTKQRQSSLISHLTPIKCCVMFWQCLKHPSSPSPQPRSTLIKAFWVEFTSPRANIVKKLKNLTKARLLLVKRNIFTPKTNLEWFKSIEVSLVLIRAKLLHVRNESLHLLISVFVLEIENRSRKGLLSVFVDRLERH